MGVFSNGQIINSRFMAGTFGSIFRWKASW